MRVGVFSLSPDYNGEENTNNSDETRTAEKKTRARRSRVYIHTKENLFVSTSCVYRRDRQAEKRTQRVGVLRQKVGCSSVGRREWPAL